MAKSSRKKNDEPATLVIFGAGGDLTWRKLVPSLYHLCVDDWLPDHFAVVGVDRKEMTTDEFRDRLRDGVEKFAAPDGMNDDTWNRFAPRLSYMTGDFRDDGLYQALSDHLSQQEKDWDARGCRVFYLATPPSMIDVIPQHLRSAHLSRDRDRARIVVEKPFGHDLDSARTLNATLTDIFHESQIFRIDHYLGKETVQNILAFRFANALFEPIWDRRYIDHVQITVAEQVGVEKRGPYYEKAGALRDMVQNHLLQVLSLVAMEPPVSFDPDEIRSKKVDLLRAVRPIHPDEVPDFAVRGQYGSGWLEGDRVTAYRHEENVAADSSTDTYAAVKLFVDNWRWQDVPFYLRTGKRLPVRASEVSIHFYPVPHKSFPSSATPGWEPNRIELRIQPDEGIQLRFQAKRPGLEMRLSPVEMRFGYKDAFETSPPEAYETLLLDVIKGDATLFMRADQVETAWSIVMPILDYWAATPAADFPNYASGSWGPEAAEALIARDGRSWLQPTVAREAISDGEDDP